MEMPARTNDPIYLRLSIITLGLTAFGYVLYVGQNVIVPFIYAVIFAILLNPVVNYLHKRGMARALAIFLTLLVSFLVAAGIIWFICSQISVFGETFPEFKQKFAQLFRQILSWISHHFGVSSRALNEYVDQAKDQGLDNSTPLLGKTLGAIGGMLAIILLLPVYIFMVLFYKPLLLEFIAQLFERDKHAAVAEVLQETKTLIQSYLVGLLIEMVLVAVLNSSALMILGIQYAVLLGIVGALLNLIPYVGGLVAISLPMLVALATKDPVYALYVLIAYILIQFIDNNIIVPRIVASKVKINALISILVVLIGGALWGVAGMFLSIPLTAILKVIFDRIQPLQPFGFLLGDNIPPIGKNFFSIRRPRKVKQD